MKHAMKKWLALLLAAVMLLSLAACGGNNAGENDDKATNDPSAANAAQDDAQQPAEEDYDGKLVSDGFMELDYANKFSIELFKGGYRMITIKDGEDETKYLTVPEDMSVPAELDADVCVLQQPISCVYTSSTAVTSICSAMGVMDPIQLVQTETWHLKDVADRMEAGTVKYAGAAKAPDYELISSCGAQLYLSTISPSEEVVAKFAELGIPNLIEQTSLENHPLGRVEWAKVFGVLFGAEEEAETYFEGQKALMAQVETDKDLGKTVALGYVSGDKCYIRNGGDYFVQMIDMVGGTYVCADLEPEKSGNTNVTFEDFYAAFGEAEYLFYIQWGEKFYSIEEMIAYNPLFADFKAVQNGNVWISSPDFAQSVASIAEIASDMSAILASEDPSQVTTDHLIKMPEKAA